MNPRLPYLMCKCGNAQSMPPDTTIGARIACKRCKGIGVVKSPVRPPIAVTEPPPPPPVGNPYEDMLADLEGGPPPTKPPKSALAAVGFAYYGCGLGMLYQAAVAVLCVVAGLAEAGGHTTYWASLAVANACSHLCFAAALAACFTVVTVLRSTVVINRE